MKLSNLIATVALATAGFALPQVVLAAAPANDRITLIQQGSNSAPVARRGADARAGHNAADDRGRGRGGRGGRANNPDGAGHK